MPNPVNIDAILRALGSHGRYQILQSILIILHTVPLSYQLLVGVFIGYDPGHECRRPENETYEVQTSANETELWEYGECSINIFGNGTDTIRNESLSCIYGHAYHRPKHLSFVSEWDLVCDKSALGDLAQTILMCGQIPGAVIMTGLGDKYGRRTVHVYCHLLSFVLSFVLAVSPNYAMFTIIRFCLGFLIPGNALTGYVLFLEWFPTEYRTIINVIGNTLWSVSVMSLAGFAYVMRDYNWRYFQVVTAVVSVHSIIELFVVVESPRWLIANKRIKEAIDIFKKVAKFNSINEKTAMDVVNQTLAESPIYKPGIAAIKYEETRSGKNVTLEGQDNLLNPKDTTTTSLNYEFNDIASGNDVIISEAPENDFGLFPKINGEDTTLTDAQDEKDTKTSLAIMVILAEPTLRWKAGALTFIWLVNSMTYYGLFLMSSSLAGDRYLNFFFTAMVELPASILLWIFLKLWGRRTSAIIFHAMAAISLLSATAIANIAGDTPAAGKAITAATIIGKLGISGSFATIWMYTPELFPTNLRSTAQGISSAVGRVGGMLAPFSRDLAKIFPWLPGTIFGSCCLVICFLLIALPETGNRELPQTISDIKAWKTEKTRDKK